MDSALAVAAVMIVLGVWTAIVAFGFAKYYVEYRKIKQHKKNDTLPD